PPDSAPPRPPAKRCRRPVGRVGGHTPCPTLMTSPDGRTNDAVGHERPDRPRPPVSWGPPVSRRRTAPGTAPPAASAPKPEELNLVTGEMTGDPDAPLAPSVNGSTFRRAGAVRPAPAA